jgi:hypothetical protein
MTIREYKILMEIVNEFKDDLTAQNNAIIKYLYPDVKVSEIEAKLALLQKELQTPEEIIREFKLDGINYGLIPNFDEMTAGEFIDLSLYENDPNQIEKVMAILYRPIVKKIKGDYIIEQYKGTQHLANKMLKADIKIYQSVITFFLTLNEQLSVIFPIYLKNKK